jgi:hypothetical protein
MEMTARHHRFSRLLAPAAIAAALAATATPAAGSGGGPGATGFPERSNAILRNDIGHFGNSRLSAPARSPVRRESRAPIVVHVDGGFDWASAVVGAAGGLGLVLAMGVAASTLRVRGRGDEARA